MSDSLPNLNEFNKAVAKTTIRINPDRKLYAITDDELILIKNFGGPIWQNIFFGSLSLFLSCGINALCELGRDNNAKIVVANMKSLYLNSVFSALGFGIAIISVVAWHLSTDTLKKLADRIKNNKEFTI